MSVHPPLLGPQDEDEFSTSSPGTRTGERVGRAWGESWERVGRRWGLTKNSKIFFPNLMLKYGKLSVTLSWRAYQQINHEPREITKADL